MRQPTAPRVRGAGRGDVVDSVKGARYRADLADALRGCVSTIPCWIMPTWRVSQALPPTVGAFDLVVVDEASQSDISALPALLRGAQVLVVGDGKQVSPTTAFVAESRIRQLQQGLLRRHPYPDQLLPGRSLFDLVQTCYGDARVSLTEHFRCVPACIAFSNERFYHDRLQPRRLPVRSQRREPALLDVHVPHGKKHNKVNAPEAEALVGWLRDNLAADRTLRDATVGIVSLGGAEQERRLRALVLSAFTARRSRATASSSAGRPPSRAMSATSSSSRSPRAPARRPTLAPSASTPSASTTSPSRARATAWCSSGRSSPPT